MKIAFLIYIGSTGSGGHYYSCLNTAKSLSLSQEVIIISVGVVESRPLLSSGMDYIHLQSTTLPKTIKKLNELIIQKEIDVLHSFDERAAYFGRLLSSKRKIKHVVTKCGGPNPTTYYPKFNSLVLYSKENYAYFSDNKKFQDTKLYLVPNRVSMPKADQSVVEDIKQQTDGKKIFIRIARIGGYYERSIRQAISLVHALNKENIPSILVVIGVVESEKILNYLKDFAQDAAIFLTEPKYTVSASKALEAADMVVGTGRSFMEAAVLGKHCLAPTNNRKYPVLACSKNIESLLFTNFSERYICHKSNDELIAEVINVLLSGSKVSSEYLEKCCELFLIDHLAVKLLEVYENAGVEEISPHLFIYETLRLNRQNLISKLQRGKLGTLLVKYLLNSRKLFRARL